MYTKQEVSQLKQEFWTIFGRYMTPVPSSEGEKVNWVNYKTGEKDIFFRMQADSSGAVIAIVLTHKEAGVRQLYFEQLLQVKKTFIEIVSPDWVWEGEAYDEYGRPVSRVSIKLDDVSVLKKEDWPRLISFFKKWMVALDSFWNDVKFGFESLR